MLNVIVRNILKRYETYIEYNDKQKALAFKNLMLCINADLGVDLFIIKDKQITINESEL